MKLIVVAMGKLKRNYFKEAQKDYAQRIKKFVPFQILELKEESTLTNRGKSGLWERWVKNFGERSLPILLDERGKQLSTLEFAHFIEEKIGNYNFFYRRAFRFLLRKLPFLCYQDFSFQTDFEPSSCPDCTFGADIQIFQNYTRRAVPPLR
jgi:hypothetical protein